MADNQTTYTYNPLLRDGALRLLHINPGTGNQPIHCTMSHTSLQNPPSYHALSYTWGEPLETHQTFINGHSYYVTENLAAALLYLRQAKAAQAYWIDRICIDQNNLLERNQQVAQMRKIYESATNVDIWLGNGSASSISLMQKMEKLNGLIIERDLESKIRSDSKLEEDIKIVYQVVSESLGDVHLGEPVFAPIIEFLSLPWWTRIWVKQELAVARTATFICSTMNLDWEHIHLSIAALRYLILRGIIDPRVESNIRFANLVVRRGFALRLKEDVIPVRKKSLLDLVYRHARSPIAEATNPRDRIYGFLGIAEDDLGIVPNYGMETRVLYCLFVKAQIRKYEGSRRRLSILSFHNEGMGERVLGLPSWAPDFVVRDGNPMASISPENAQRWFASGVGVIHQLPISFDSVPEVLPVPGVCFGRVGNLGPSGTIAKLNDDGKIQNTSKTELFHRCHELALRVEKFINLDLATSREEMVDEVWRSLIQDIGFTSTSSKVIKPRAESSILLQYQVLQGLESPPADFLPGCEENERRISFTRRYVQEVRSRLHRSQLFLSNNGHLGTGSEKLLKGDMLCVLMGAEVPFALRREERGYRIVCELYTFGFMDGEALTSGNKVEVFELV